MRIKGGDGRIADVDEANRLQTYAVTQNLQQTLLFKELLSSVYFAVVPANANDYFFYLKNNGTTHVGINFALFSSSVVTNILFEAVTGTPVYVTGADAAITNLVIGSPKGPDVEAKYDTDITGLTSAGILTLADAPVAEGVYQSQLMGGIVIPQGQAIAIKRVAATGDIKMNLSLGVMAF